MIFFMIIASLGGILYGYDVGIITAAFLFMNKTIPMSTQQLSLLGGSVLFGGAFATSVSCYRSAHGIKGVAALADGVTDP